MKVRLKEPIIKKSIVPGLTQSIDEINFRSPTFRDMRHAMSGIEPNTGAVLICFNYMVILNENGLKGKDFDGLCTYDSNRVMAVIGKLVSEGLA